MKGLAIFTAPIDTKLHETATALTRHRLSQSGLLNFPIYANWQNDYNPNLCWYALSTYSDIVVLYCGNYSEQFDGRMRPESAVFNRSVQNDQNRLHFLIWTACDLEDLNFDGFRTVVKDPLYAQNEINTVPLIDLLAQIIC